MCGRTRAALQACGRAEDRRGGTGSGQGAGRGQKLDCAAASLARSVSRPRLDPTLEFLDPGERAALALAGLLQADEVLIDERDGRTEAARRYLHITGTVGVLADAHLAGLLDFDQAVARLRNTNFRLSVEVERLARRRLASQKKES